MSDFKIYIPLESQERQDQGSPAKPPLANERDSDRRLATED